MVRKFFYNFYFFIFIFSSFFVNSSYSVDDLLKKYGSSDVVLEKRSDEICDEDDFSDEIDNSDENDDYDDVNNSNDDEGPLDDNISDIYEEEDDDQLAFSANDDEENFVDVVEGIINKFLELAEKMRLYVTLSRSSLVQKTDGAIVDFSKSIEKWRLNKSEPSLNEMMNRFIKIFMIISSESLYIFSNSELLLDKSFNNDESLIVEFALSMEREFMNFVQYEDDYRLKNAAFREDTRKIAELVAVVSKVITEIMSNSPAYCGIKKEGIFGSVLSFFSDSYRLAAASKKRENEQRVMMKLQLQLENLQGLLLNLNYLDMNSDGCEKILNSSLRELFQSIVLLELFFSNNFCSNENFDISFEKISSNMKSLCKRSVRNNCKSEQIRCLSYFVSKICDKQKVYLIPAYRKLYKKIHGLYVAHFESNKRGQIFLNIFNFKMLSFLFAWKSIYDYFSEEGDDSLSLFGKSGRMIVLLFQAGVKLFNGGYADGRAEMMQKLSIDAKKHMISGFGISMDKLFPNATSNKILDETQELTKLCMNYFERVETQRNFDARINEYKSHDKDPEIIKLREGRENAGVKQAEEKINQWAKAHGVCSGNILEPLRESLGKEDSVSITDANISSQVKYNKREGRAALAAIQEICEQRNVVKTNHNSIKNFAQEFALNTESKKFGICCMAFVAAMATSFSFAKFEEATGMFFKVRNMLDNMHYWILGESKDNAVDFSNNGSKHSEYTIDDAVFDGMRERGMLSWFYSILSQLSDPFGSYFPIKRVVLITGPSGSGKTMLAESFAQSVANTVARGARVQFIEIDPKHLHITEVGPNGKEQQFDIFDLITQLIDEARNSATPTTYIIYLDELHLFFMGPKGQKQADNRLLADFLKLFTNLKKKQAGTPYGVYIIASTNKPELVPHEIFDNPDRIQTFIHIAYPNYQERIELMQNYLKKFGIPVNHIDFEEISRVLEPINWGDEQVSQGKLVAILQLAMVNAKMQHMIFATEHILAAINTLVRRIIFDDSGLENYFLQVLVQYYAAQTSIALLVNSSLVFHAVTIYRVSKQITPKSFSQMYERPELLPERYGKIFLVNSHSNNIDLISLEKMIDTILVSLSGSVYEAQRHKIADVQIQDICLPRQSLDDKEGAFEKAYNLCYFLENDYAAIAEKVSKFGGVGFLDFYGQRKCAKGNQGAHFQGLEEINGIKHFREPKRDVLYKGGDMIAMKAVALLKACEEYLTEVMTDKDFKFDQTISEIGTVLRNKKYVDAKGIRENNKIQCLLTEIRPKYTEKRDKLIQTVRRIIGG